MDDQKSSSHQLKVTSSRGKKMSNVESKKDAYLDMPLTNVLSEWLIQEEWEDEIEVQDDRKSSHVVTSMSIEYQSHKMYLEADETKEWLSVYLYGPVKVPPDRFGEMSRLLNLINHRLGLGRIVCIDEEDGKRVQFLARVDVEGSVLRPKQIDNLVRAACGTFRNYGSIIAAIAITKQSAQDGWAELLSGDAGADKQALETGEGGV